MTEPRTAAGRALLDKWGTPTLRAWLKQEVLAIEAEAAVLDYEQMRMDRRWPTPISMRDAADALDMLVIPRYGDVLRWFADLCDAALPEQGEQP